VPGISQRHDVTAGGSLPVLPRRGRDRRLGKAGTLTAAAAPVSARILRRAVRSGRFRRIAVVGTPRTAGSLKRELSLAGASRVDVVGCICGHGVDAWDQETPVVGTMAELRTVIERHRIDLLVVSGEAPRLSIFDQAVLFSGRRVRVCELTDLYEAVFGHVPTAEINASWFDYLVHPCYRESRPAKRALDIALALFLALVLFPLVAALALAVISDGGPLLFRQVRIGEHGRRIAIYKLRTMRPGSGSLAQWSHAQDPRVTRIGRFLRRTHLDEFPQLLNVLRGEMSMVGPRPEQPAFVTRLEHVLPFYDRRHLIKPGLTGWAQIRCGYAGSDRGSAWKLCHDLFYMKYRSMRLDLLILVRTLRLALSPSPAKLERNPDDLAEFVAGMSMPVMPARGRREQRWATPEIAPHRAEGRLVATGAGTPTSPV
jgi:lipopolysaccharide/colanic/teichoic acid biosynthesis glycosyltransferase